ncbi:hypothetical protein TSAR_009900 [Trichomalopsis sarcophagae]|uniref:Uncharacterized protein n=1 Tax=Trichomalopsis sarcophagae TaxID=543379 RepID=A0A232F112_9HYME|nr:hypothetical protein TSAR_009900 [Trichomalopsis sarcophagae]
MQAMTAQGRAPLLDYSSSSSSLSAAVTAAILLADF